MHTFSSRLPALFAVLTLAPAVLLAAGSTAGASLPKARAAAVQWSPDAVLVAISTLEIDDQGTAESWLYNFYSPSAQGHLSVTVSEGSVETNELTMRFTTPITDEFIDSDRAMALAKEHGLKGDTPAMGLNALGPGDVIRWWVNGGAEPGDVSVVLDAATGKLWRKEVIRDS